MPAAYSRLPWHLSANSFLLLEYNSNPYQPETPGSLALLPSGFHLTPPLLPHALCSSHPGLWRSSDRPGCPASGPLHRLFPLPARGASGFWRQEGTHTWFLLLPLAQVQFSYSVRFQSTLHWPPWKLVWGPQATRNLLSSFRCLFQKDRSGDGSARSHTFPQRSQREKHPRSQGKTRPLCTSQTRVLGPTSSVPPPAGGPTLTSVRR